MGSRAIVLFFDQTKDAFPASSDHPNLASAWRVWQLQQVRKSVRLNYGGLDDPIDSCLIAALPVGLGPRVFRRLVWGFPQPEPAWNQAFTRFRGRLGLVA